MNYNGRNEINHSTDKRLDIFYVYFGETWECHNGNGLYHLN